MDSQLISAPHYDNRMCWMKCDNVNRTNLYKMQWWVHVTKPSIDAVVRWLTPSLLHHAPARCSVVSAALCGFESSVGVARLGFMIVTSVVLPIVNAWVRKPRHTHTPSCCHHHRPLRLSLRQHVIVLLLIIMVTWSSQVSAVSINHMQVVSATAKSNKYDRPCSCYIILNMAIV